MKNTIVFKLKKELKNPKDSEKRKKANYKIKRNPILLA